MCSKHIFFSKVAQKGKICSRLLELQKIAPSAKNCSKVVEHNRERPTYDVKLPHSKSYGERGYVTQGFSFSFSNLDEVLENSLKVEKLRRWNESLKFETMRIHFLQWRFRCQNAWARIWVAIFSLLRSLFLAPTQWGRTGSRKGAPKLRGGWEETEYWSSFE